MTAALSIRPATVADLDGVLALYDELHPDDPEVAPEVAAAATIEGIVSTPGLTLFLLEEGDALIGSTFLNVVPNLTRGARPYAIIENVLARP